MYTQVVFRYSDLECVTAVLTKQAVELAMTTDLSHEKNGPRMFLQNAVVDILHKYRAHCSPHSPKGQLILPDSLKIIPLYLSTVLKHPAFIENKPPNSSSPRTNNGMQKRYVCSYLYHTSYVYIHICLYVIPYEF